MVAQRDGDDRDAAARRCGTTPRHVQAGGWRSPRGGVAHPIVGGTEDLIGVLMFDRRSAAEHSIYSFGQAPRKDRQRRPDDWPPKAHMPNTRQPPGPPPSGRWGVDVDTRLNGPFRGAAAGVSICPQALESASTLSVFYHVRGTTRGRGDIPRQAHTIKCDPTCARQA